MALLLASFATIKPFNSNGKVVMEVNVLKMSETTRNNTLNKKIEIFSRTQGKKFGA
jgi:hypothetical protein